MTASASWPARPRSTSPPCIAWLLVLLGAQPHVAAREPLARDRAIRPGLEMKELDSKWMTKDYGPQFAGLIRAGIRPREARVDMVTGHTGLSERPETDRRNLPGQGSGGGRVVSARQPSTAPVRSQRGAPAGGRGRDRAHRSADQRRPQRRRRNSLGANLKSFRCRRDEDDRGPGGPGRRLGRLSDCPRARRRREAHHSELDELCALQSRVPTGSAKATAARPPTFT